MARVAKDVKAIQSFRGGLNDLSKNPHLQQIGNGCCEVAPVIDQDRLNATIHSENALVHTRPAAHRDHWQFSELDDTTRRRTVAHVNTNGVGSILEVLVIPTFAFLQSVHIAVFAEETGLEFEVTTRNGTVLPSGKLIKVAETDAGSGCGDVARVQSVGSLAAVGLLGGASRVHTIALSDKGGEFALEADVIQLKVKSLPADGVLGRFDLRVHATYLAVGRSEAAR